MQEEQVTLRHSVKPSSTRLGDRVRQLRVAAGLTQTDLAGDRFSKEYVSQIERGKTRPTPETVAWLAQRLGVDASFLEHGVSVDERERIEAALARAAALTESDRFADAVAEYEHATSAIEATASPELELRMLVGHAWAKMRLGEVHDAIDFLMRAREIAERPQFSDLDRADVLFRLGVCRYKLSSISTAIALLNEALLLADRSELPADGLRSRIFAVRSRCYRRQRDWEAGREDIEKALELAQASQDRQALAEAYFQASLIADRNGHWIRARRFAELARDAYEEIGDRGNVGRLLNNLGAFNFLLGRADLAESQLKDAFRVALDVGSESDAAFAVSTLAQVHLRTGDIIRAEEQARHALELLDGRIDLIEEAGKVRLVLGRALMEQGLLPEAEKTLDDAEKDLEQLSSKSHRAAIWIARGDLAAKRNDDALAAHYYRRAAEALQDIEF